MKDYKEKYEQALERASKLRVQNPFDTVGQMVEHIFPELQESEDERIRKGIIRNLEYLADRAEGFVKDELKERIAWLEKQGEQKTTDKTKTKFKDGDYIVPSNITLLEIWRVISIDEDGYYNIQSITNHDDDEIYRVPAFTLEKDYRLWTINDAKDGDILVNGSNIFIFHFINGTRLMGYCHVNIDDGRFYDDIGRNEYFCLIDAIVTPATKEQRELLFVKMKQKGYEWDTENKKLSKQTLKITPKFCVGQLITDNNGNWYKILNIECSDDWYYKVYDIAEDKTQLELCSIVDEKFREMRFDGEIKKMMGD